MKKKELKKELKKLQALVESVEKNGLSNDVLYALTLAMDYMTGQYVDATKVREAIDKVLDGRGKKGAPVRVNGYSEFLAEGQVVTLGNVVISVYEEIVCIDISKEKVDDRAAVYANQSVVQFGCSGFVDEQSREPQQRSNEGSIEGVISGDIKSDGGGEARDSSVECPICGVNEGKLHPENGNIILPCSICQGMKY